MSIEQNPLAREPCPCCEHLTLGKRGWYEICPVCFWEDDPAVERDGPAVPSSPNEEMTLDEGRANFARLGASNERRTKLVRDPLPWECPPP